MRSDLREIQVILPWAGIGFSNSQPEVHEAKVMGSLALIG